MGGGARPTSRLFIFIPNGTDLVEFILTCPTPAYAKLQAEVLGVVKTVAFSGKPGVKPQPAAPTPEPATSEPEGAAAPASSERHTVAVAVAQGFLKQKWQIPLESLPAPAACDLVLYDTGYRKAFRTIVADAQVDKDGRQQAWVVTRARAEAADVVVLLNPGNRWGALLPAVDYRKNAKASDAGYVLAVESLRKLTAEDPGRYQEPGPVLDALCALPEPEPEKPEQPAAAPAQPAPQGDQPAAAPAQPAPQAGQ